jgi:hypothetical protein
MKLTNSGEYRVDVFGVILAPGESLDGAECATKLNAHPELANSIGCNGLTCDAEASKLLKLPTQPIAEQVTTTDDGDKKPVDPKRK